MPHNRIKKTLAGFIPSQDTVKHTAHTVTTGALDVSSIGLKVFAEFADSLDNILEGVESDLKNNLIPPLRRTGKEFEPVCAAITKMITEPMQELRKIATEIRNTTPTTAIDHSTKLATKAMRIIGKLMLSSAAMHDTLPKLAATKVTKLILKSASSIFTVFSGYLKAASESLKEKPSTRAIK